jgi:3',5'-cyclic AMP phosphodiesterase CpdA
MTRILHFSDVHFPLSRNSISLREIMRPKRILASANYLLRRRPKFTDANIKWSAFERFFDNSKFDAVICTGDLSGMGMHSELDYAHNKLKNISRHPNFILLPGNHDLYLPEKNGSYFYDIFKNNITKSDIATNSNSPYPLVKLINNNVAIIAINSAKPNPSLIRSSGNISTEQLSELDSLLDTSELKSRKIIVATHYNADNEDTNLHGLENRKVFREILARHNCTMLVHGHIHKSQRYNVPETNTKAFCAGSLTYKGRESFWVYNIDKQITAQPGSWNYTEYLLGEEQTL